MAEGERLWKVRDLTVYLDPPACGCEVATDEFQECRLARTVSAHEAGSPLAERAVDARKRRGAVWPLETDVVQGD